MKGIHPPTLFKETIRMKPWYVRGVVASPYEPKPVVIPKAMRRHPVYSAKWRAMSRPIYTNLKPVQQYQPQNIRLHIGPGIQPTNPAITLREEAYMRPWSNYKPYKGWPMREPARQVNV